MEEIFFKEASAEQLRHVSPFRMQKVKKIDAQIGLWAETNTRRFTGIGG